MGAKVELEFRIAEKGDAEAIAALVNSAYRGESGARGWTTEAHLIGGQRTDREKIAEIVASADVLLLACRKDSSKQIVGSVHMTRKEPLICYLGMLTVEVGLQASGVGRQLLLQAEKYAKGEWQSVKVEMTVISIRSELVDWYRRRGYRVTDEKREFPYGDLRFGEPFRDDLDFIVLEKIL